jgi:hypothetical protein
VEKMKRYISIFIVITVFLGLLTVCPVALDPPYREYTADDGELMELLKDYIDKYTLGISGYGRKREGYRYEQRQVIWPNAADSRLSVQSCEYGERRYGDGVNYIRISFFETEEIDISVTLYYDYADPVKIYKRYFGKPKNSKKTIEEGVYNCMPYFAETYVKSNGETFCHYNMVIGNILVSVYDAKPFSVERIGLIQYEATDILLPVFVNESNYLSEKSTLPHVWIYCGTAFILVLAGFIILLIKHKRKKTDIV